MNRTTLVRKLVYLFVLLAMLVPLYMLGQPPGGGSDAGGRLAEMRTDFNIAESDLGEINPASATMKLVTLGLRNVAATLLWNKAHEYRVTHEWDRLRAAVNQITLLQPHYDKVWEFHAHNLSYNVSTEFDDYRQRYEMVREGTEFLQQGVRQNRKATRLVWYTGWFYGSKMGMADEKRQFRRLFSDDEVLHQGLLTEKIAVDSPQAWGPEGKPDNWLVGRLWLHKGYDLVDSAGVKIRRQTPLNFYETGPKWRIKHAEAIESEGVLDYRAQNRWELALEDWEAFGDRSIPTTSPFTIRLGHIEDLKRTRDERFEEFREITGETFTKAVKVLEENLPQDLKTIWLKPDSQRSEDDKKKIPAIEFRLIPDLPSVAKESDPSVRLRAISLVGEIADLEAKVNKTEGYRTQINYAYWHTLTRAEQEERTVKARRLIFEAEEANERAELDRAIELYEEAFAIWREIYDDYPILTIDDTAEDVYESIRRYMIAIDSQEFPDDFPLKAFVVMMQNYGEVDAPTYAEVMESLDETTEKRQAELEAEEREREAAAARAEQEAQNPDSNQPATADNKPPAESAEQAAADKDPAGEKEMDQKAEETPANEPTSEDPPSEQTKDDAEPKEMKDEDPQDEPKSEEPKDEPQSEDAKEEPKDEESKDDAKSEEMKEDPKDEEPKDEPQSEDAKEEPKDEESKDDAKSEEMKEEPKDEEPKDEPQSEDAKEEPKDEESKDDAKSEEMKEEPKDEEPKDEPQSEDAKEEPKDEDPQDEPKTDEPKSEEPPEEPASEEPKDEPASEAPESEEPDAEEDSEAAED